MCAGVVVVVVVCVCVRPCVRACVCVVAVAAVAAARGRYTQYDPKDGVFCTTDGTAEHVIRYAPSGPASEAEFPATTLPKIFQDVLKTKKANNSALRVERPCPPLVDKKAPPALAPEDWTTWTYKAYYDECSEIAKVTWPRPCVRPLRALLPRGARARARWRWRGRGRGWLSREAGFFDCVGCPTATTPTPPHPATRVRRCGAGRGVRARTA